MPVLGLAAAAITMVPPTADASRLRKGPYLQNVSQRSVTIMWETQAPADGAVELIGNEPRTIRVEADEIQEVVLSDLEPGRRYRYAVTVAGERHEGEFATAPETGAPYSFIVFGDSRSGVSSHTRVVERIRAEVPDFLLGTGDMVNEGASEHDWQTFFEIERDLLRENVLFPSLGNHDRQGRGRTADNYRRYFSLPDNSPDPERYYAFTYGNARFLVLDSNAYSFALTDQTAWIEQQLQAARLDPEIRHIFVTMHHPPYSVSLHGGQEELREAWTPLFVKYQVGAVFSGHDHVYSRARKDGVHYFVSGGGGAPLYPRKRNASRLDLEALRYFERVNHYLHVRVYGDLVEVAAVRVDGTLIESASWGEPPAAEGSVADLVERARKQRARHMPPSGSGQQPGEPASVHAAQEASSGRLGAMGYAGVAVVLLAAGFIVWTLRR